MVQNHETSMLLNNTNVGLRYALLLSLMLLSSRKVSSKADFEDANVFARKQNYNKIGEKINIFLLILA